MVAALEALKTAAYLLARSARRYYLTPLTPEATAKAVLDAIEVLISEGGGYAEGFKAPRATRAGPASRYLLINSPHEAIVASVGYGGWVMAALVYGDVVDVLERGGRLGSEAELGPLGSMPMIAYSVRIDYYPRLPEEAYACRVDGGGSVDPVKASYAAVMSEIDRVMWETLQALLALPEGEEDCRVEEVLREAGWEVSRGRGALRASMNIGERIAAIVVGGVVPGRLVEERAYVEACGEVVELEASAMMASGAVEVLDCIRVGGNIEARVGGFKVVMESGEFVAACASRKGYESLPAIIPRRPLPPIPCDSEVSGRSLITVSEGDLVVRASLGGLTASSRLIGPRVLAVAPMPVKVAVVVPPTGEPIIIRGGLAGDVVEIVNPGYTRLS